jgi:hypothetical protein
MSSVTIQAFKLRSARSDDEVRPPQGMRRLAHSLAIGLSGVREHPSQARDGFEHDCSSGHSSRRSGRPAVRSERSRDPSTHGARTPGTTRHRHFAKASAERSVTPAAIAGLARRSPRMSIAPEHAGTAPPESPHVGNGQNWKAPGTFAIPGALIGSGGALRNARLREISLVAWATSAPPHRAA